MLKTARKLYFELGKTGKKPTTVQKIQQIYQGKKQTQDYQGSSLFLVESL